MMKKQKTEEAQIREEEEAKSNNLYNLRRNRKRPSPPLSKRKRKEGTATKRAQKTQNGIQGTDGWTLKSPKPRNNKIEEPKHRESESRKALEKT
jgi:hypothetical protein